MTGRPLHVVLPASVDDPALPSGGNHYDRQVVDGLAASGWAVHRHLVPGRWPWPDDAAHRALAAELAALPDGAVTLVDGLLASSVPDLLVPAGRRLRVVVLLHMVVGDRGGEGARREAVVLDSAARTVTTSEWLRRRVLADYGLDPEQVHAAPPGVDLVPGGAGGEDAGTGRGRRLLCVGAVTPGKGLDVLATALRRVADLPWQCSVVGPLTRAPGFVADLRHLLAGWGLTDRVVLTGPVARPALRAAYGRADLLVHPSLGESYGMVVTEALAHGVPVLATSVGGVPEALGTAPDGRLPGLLVPPGDVGALADALRRWLSEPGLRDDLRAAVRERRPGLTGWSLTTDRVDRVLRQVAA